MKKKDVKEARETKVKGLRTLDNLRSAYQGKIYIWFESDEVYEQFKFNAKNQGYMIGSYQPEECPWERDILSLQQEKKLTACNIISYCAFNEGKDVVRVDYGKYIAGDEDYLIEGEEIEKKGYKVKFLQTGNR